MPGAYLLAASQIHQVELPTQLLLRLHVLLLDVDQEDAVAPGAVLVHVCAATTRFTGFQQGFNRVLIVLLYMYVCVGFFSIDTLLWKLSRGIVTETISTEEE